jgi:hypothetical protein
MKQTHALHWNTTHRNMKQSLTTKQKEIQNVAMQKHALVLLRHARISCKTSHYSQEMEIF